MGVWGGGLGVWGFGGFLWFWGVLGFRAWGLGALWLLGLVAVAVYGFRVFGFKGA